MIQNTLPAYPAQLADIDIDAIDDICAYYVLHGMRHDHRYNLGDVVILNQVSDGTGLICTVFAFHDLDSTPPGYSLLFDAQEFTNQAEEGEEAEMEPCGGYRTSKRYCMGERYNSPALWGSFHSLIF